MTADRTRAYVAIDSGKLAIQFHPILLGLHSVPHLLLYCYRVDKILALLRAQSRLLLNSGIIVGVCVRGMRVGYHQMN